MAHATLTQEWLDNLMDMLACPRSAGCSACEEERALLTELWIKHQ